MFAAAVAPKVTLRDMDVKASDALPAENSDELPNCRSGNGAGRGSEYDTQSDAPYTEKLKFVCLVSSAVDAGGFRAVVDPPGVCADTAPAVETAIITTATRVRQGMRPTRFAPRIVTER